MQRSEDVTILSPEVLRWFDCQDGDQLESLLRGLYEDAGVRLYAAFKYIPFEKLTAGYSRDATVIKTKDLTPMQKAALSGAVAMGQWARHARSAFSEDIEGRRHYAGVLDGARAWTDGSRSIFHHLEILAAASKGEKGMWALLHDVVHEYCHDEPDADTHLHGEEFYELFHNVMQFIDVPRALLDGYRAMAKSLRDNKRRVPVWLQRATSKGSLDGEIPVYFEDDEAPQDQPLPVRAAKQSKAEAKPANTIESNQLDIFREAS